MLLVNIFTVPTLIVHFPFFNMLYLWTQKKLFQFYKEHFAAKKLNLYPLLSLTILSYLYDSLRDKVALTAIIR